MRIAAAIIATTIAAVALAHAQTPGTPTAPVPEAMPFDIPYGTPIGLDEAQKAIMGAVAEAKKHNWKMSISVVDPNGYLGRTCNDGWHTIRFDLDFAGQGADRGAVPPAVRARSRPRSTPAVRRRTSACSALNGAVASEGGFPIVIDGKLVGRDRRQRRHLHPGRRRRQSRPGGGRRQSKC